MRSIRKCEKNEFEVYQWINNSWPKLWMLRPIFLTIHSQNIQFFKIKDDISQNVYCLTMTWFKKKKMYK